MVFSLLADETIQMILSYAGGHMSACFLVFKEEEDLGNNKRDAEVYTGMWRCIVVQEDLTISRFCTAREPCVSTLPPASNIDSVCMMRMLAKLTIEMEEDGGLMFNPGPKGFEQLSTKVCADRNGSRTMVVEYDCPRLGGQEFEVCDVFGVQPNRPGGRVNKRVEKLYNVILKAANTDPVVFNNVDNVFTFRTVGVPMAAYACSVTLSTRRMLQPLGGPFVKITEAVQGVIKS